MCRYSQICQNTVGGYGCICPRGYRSQGVGLPCLGRFFMFVFLTQTFLYKGSDVKSKFFFYLQTLMNVRKHQILARTSVVTYPAASGVCAPLGLCCWGTDAPVQGWSGAKSSLTAPESGPDSTLSWCHPSVDRSSPAPAEYLALPGRAVLWATPAEMVHVQVGWSKHLISGSIEQL